MPSVTREEWNGVVSGGRTSSAELAMQGTLGQGTQGSSGAFLALGEDGRRYWVKPLNNQQSVKVPVNEQLVARVARLISAPVCEVKTMSIDPALAGWEFRSGCPLESGIAHASLEVTDVVEVRALSNHADDDNQARHASILALYDWCWGNDEQWLRAIKDENKYYSHDHGHYFPAGPAWSAGDLESNVDTPHELSAPCSIMPATADTIASRMRSITRAQLKTVLQAIPAPWPVSDTDLESVGYFLERRAHAAADRLVARVGGVR